MNQRAFSALEIKSVSEDRRVIAGLATSPVPDRCGDVVDPFGAKFAETIPLFLYHDSRLPVGTVKLGKPTSKGIPFEATLPKVAEVGALQSRVDEAWQMVKYKLIAAVSIGFREVAGKVETLKGGGLKFLESEILELSLVPIPMQSLATIQTIKSFDASTRDSLGIKTNDIEVRAAIGRDSPRSHTPPGASGTKAPASGGFSFSRSRKGIEMKTIQELRDERNTKAARMSELLTLSKADDRDMDESEAGEFDSLEIDVKKLDGEIRQVRFDTLNASTAKAVDGSSAEAASRSRGGMSFVRKEDPEDTFKGQSFTRMVIAKAVAHLNQSTPSAIAQHRWGKTHPGLVRLIKANEVAGGGTGSGEWGSELVAMDGRYTGDFIEYLHQMTVFDKLPLREVPGDVTIKGSDGAATANWVGESKAIPVSAPSASTVNLTPLKVAALAVVSNELLMRSSPSAEQWVRDMLAKASSQRVDLTFLSATAASAGVSPAGLLNGVSAITSSGLDADGIRRDIAALMAPFIAARNVSNLTFVTTPALGLQLQLMRNALGQREFDGVSMNGGTLEGIRLVTGDNVGAGDLILLSAPDIWKIADSGIRVDLSREATIAQNSAPVGATDTPVGETQAMTNMFQEDSTAIRVIRSINFQKRRSDAVQYIGDAEYGQVS